jgi:hypothetical protein
LKISKVFVFKGIWVERLIVANFSAIVGRGDLFAVVEKSGLKISGAVFAFDPNADHRQCAVAVSAIAVIEPNIAERNKEKTTCVDDDFALKNS